MKSSFNKSLKSGATRTSRSSKFADEDETQEIVNPLIAGLSMIEDDEDSYDEDLHKKWQKRLNYNLNIKKKMTEQELEVSDEENASKYYIDRKLHRNADNKVEYGLCITANERTDDAWKLSPHASLEAKLYTEDVELARDLQEMGRVRVS